MMTEKTAEALWQDYLFLTNELKKFLDQQDMELFHELMAQRERLQSIIEETPDEGFKLSPQGLTLLTEIERKNQIVANELLLKHSRAKLHHQVSEVYNNAGNASVSRINWER